MPLFITEKDVFTIPVRYVEKDNTVLYLDEKEAEKDSREDSFTFRRPNWADTRVMMADTMYIDPTSGNPIMDPYRFMDRKIKILLVDWTLMDGEQKRAITPENIDKLDPSLINYLNQRLDEHLTFKKTENS